MVKLYDKIELLEEIKIPSGRHILKGSRGTILKVNPDNSYTVEIKIYNPMMLRSYEFQTIIVTEDKIRVLDFKGNVVKS